MDHYNRRMFSAIALLAIHLAGIITTILFFFLKIFKVGDQYIISEGKDSEHVKIKATHYKSFNLYKIVKDSIKHYDGLDKYIFYVILGILAFFTLVTLIQIFSLITMIFSRKMSQSAAEKITNSNAKSGLVPSFYSGIISILVVFIAFAFTRIRLVKNIEPKDVPDINPYMAFFKVNDATWIIFAVVVLLLHSAVVVVFIKLSNINKIIANETINNNGNVNISNPMTNNFNNDIHLNHQSSNEEFTNDDLKE